MKKSFALIVSALLASALITVAFKKKIMKSRGERNNNPFNIVKSPVEWVGKTIGTDGRFETFITQPLGIRAGLVNLYNGYFRHGLTLTEILNKYAPAHENNTSAYIDFVAKRAGVGSDQSVFTKDERLKIAEAILYMENGKQIATVEELRGIAVSYNIVNYFV